MAAHALDDRVATTLPAWPSLLAVVAHPDDESFGLGAVLGAFVGRGTRATVLALTYGEASTLHGVVGDLSQLRAAELRAAAEELGVATTALRDHPDGALAACGPELVDDVLDVARQESPAGLLTFDTEGVTGHPDHAAATSAALAAAETLDLPVLGWTLPAAVARMLNEELGTAFRGHRGSQIDLVVTVDRARQRRASMAHASQAVPTSVLWRRLELLGDVEHLRWLRRRTADDGRTPV